MSIRQAQKIDPLSLSYCNPCQPIFPSSPTHAASSAMPQERSLTVLDLLDTSYALVIPAPCQSFFSKTLGRTLTGKSTCSSTCFLSDIQRPYALSMPKKASPTHSHAALSATQPQNCLSRRYFRCTRLLFPYLSDPIS